MRVQGDEQGELVGELMLRRMAVRLKVVVSLWMVAVAAGTACAQNATQFHLALPPGPHGVGLKVVEQYDASRSYLPLTDAVGKPTQGERARPLQTLIWYPGETSKGSLWAS